MGSTRLPNKVMLKLLGKPALWHVVHRAKRAGLVDKVIVATTTSKADDAIGEFCRKEGIDFCRGSEDDVLDRFHQCAKKFGLDVIVRITADCPLHDPTVIDRVVQEYRKGGYDYASNVHPPTYPDGVDVEVFSAAALARAWREAGLKSEREHVTPYIWGNNTLFKVANVTNDRDLSSHRWTLDEPRDYEFIRAVFERLGTEEFGMAEVLALLRKEPALAAINRDIGRNEGYAKSLREEGRA